MRPTPARTRDYTAAEFGVSDPEFENYTFRSTRNSVALRRNYNLAVAYSQKLGFLPKPLNGTSFNVSYNRAYMTARRNGLAPRRISSRLSYAYQKFNGNIGMVWIDDRPDGIYGRYRRELTLEGLAQVGGVDLRGGDRGLAGRLAAEMVGEAGVGAWSRGAPAAGKGERVAAGEAVFHAVVIVHRAGIRGDAVDEPVRVLDGRRLVHTRRRAAGE
jgi:hypothetical protein